MKALKYSSIATVLLTAWLVWSNLPVRLPVPTLNVTELPAANSPADMSLSSLPTARQAAKAGFTFRGGSFAEDRESVQTGLLVHHPKGDLLFDTGMGRHAAEHASSRPWLVRKVSSLTLLRPAADQLAEQRYDLEQLVAIVPTHAHWDHISGLPDFPGTPIWMNAAEENFIATGGRATELVRGFGKLPIRRYDFERKPYLGFDRSFDFWGDGSVVLVPAPGHTPGSIIAFITLPSGRRYGLLGDLVWQTDGIERPAERPWQTRLIVDSDAARVRATIGHVAALRRRFTQITWLPAHDARALARVPVFPAVTQ